MNDIDPVSTEPIAEALARVQTWIDGLRYKAGWEFQVDEEDGRIVLAATMRVPDIRRSAGGMTTVVGRIPLNPISIRKPRAFLDCVYSLVTHLELHEVGEWLTFDGERPFDPHVSGQNQP